MKVTFEKEVQGLTGCAVSVSLSFSEDALSELYETSTDDHGVSGQSFLLGALLAETVHLLDRSEITVLSSLLDSYRRNLSAPTEAKEQL